MDKPANLLGCVVVDDEPLAIDLLQDHIEQSPDLKLIRAFTDPIEALRFLRNTSIDLLLLDIQMPEISGLQFARIINEECKVIFTTAYGEYALESYELNAVDYLLKPISFQRFQRAVDKLLPISEAVPSAVETGDQSGLIFVKSGHKTIRILVEDILYLSGSGDYVTIHLASGNKLLTLEKLGDFERKLSPPQFCRIHRSHLVALDKIEFIERQRVVVRGQWLPISQSYQERFWKLVEGRS